MVNKMHFAVIMSFLIDVVWLVHYREVVFVAVWLFIEQFYSVENNKALSTVGKGLADPEMGLKILSKKIVYVLLIVKVFYDTLF